jgi:spermidine synthase/tetratricopeptide (TPR) repeat protein
MLVYMVALVGVVVLPPSMAFGAVFPLVARAEVAGGSSAGPAVGIAYAANILGAVTGAYVGGFVLVPLLGLSGTIRFTAFALLSFAALLAWRGRSRFVAAVLCVAAAVMPLLPGQTLHRTGPGERLLHYEEGSSATVSVVRDPLGSKSIYVDGVPVAGTDPVMQTDQKSLAHLPMLLHSAARKVLTVGFGSGGASWSYTRYPSLERIDCVEIAPEVLRAAPYLREANHDLFSDPRYRVIIDDARSFLEHADETYDVIATDCTDLQYRGNASLYTADYFNLCRRRLNSKGLVVVWMPLGGMSDDVFRMAIATFASVFANVSVWYINNYPTHYLLLVGSEDGHAVSWEDLLDRISVPEVRADLESIGLADPFRFLSTFLLDDGAVRELVRGASINQDDLPLLEFRAPRSTDRFAGARNLEALLDLASLRNPSPPFTTRYGERQRRTIEAKLEPYLRASRHLNRGHVHYQNGLQDFEAAIARYREAAQANPLQEREVDSLVRATARTRDELLRAYEEAASTEDRSPGVLLNFGLTLLAAGESVRAMETFETLAEERPGLADAHVNLSRAALAAGDEEKAVRAAETAIERAPLRADAHFQRALSLEASERPSEALEAYHRALQLRPEMVEARFNRGTILAGLGRLEEAREEYQRGLALRPSDDRARLNFAGVLLLQGDEVSAARELQIVAEAGGPAAAQAAEMLQRLERGVP